MKPAYLKRPLQGQPAIQPCHGHGEQQTLLRSGQCPKSLEAYDAVLALLQERGAKKPDVQMWKMLHQGHDRKQVGLKQVLELRGRMTCQRILHHPPEEIHRTVEASNRRVRSKELRLPAAGALSEAAPKLALSCARSYLSSDFIRPGLDSTKQWKSEV